jgi:hypothetical protein
MAPTPDTAGGLSVRRIVISTLWFSAALAVAAYGYFGFWPAVSYLVGSAWMTANFVLLAWLLTLMTTRFRPSLWFILFVFCAKILIVFAVLYWIFQLRQLNPLGLVAGITTLLVVVLLKAAGSAIIVGSPHTRETGNEEVR